jgi:osmotically-inducible protein OsmY
MHASAPEELFRRSDAQEVIAEARERLKSASYAPVRNVSCEYDEGVLFLRGQVPSFFQKQLAQEAVFKLDGVTSVVNQIEVTGRPCNGDE